MGYLPSHIQQALRVALPNALTLGNAACGFTAIVLASKSEPGDTEAIRYLAMAGGGVEGLTTGPGTEAGAATIAVALGGCTTKIVEPDATVVTLPRSPGRWLGLRLPRPSRP